MLDGHNIVRHVASLSPYVSDSIWIGKLNNIHSRVSAETEADRTAIQRIVSNQTNERIHAIYSSLKDHPLVKWKESIKKVVGMTISTEPGQDQ